MSKRQLLCLLGVWVMIFLFLGFRSDWDNIIAVITGLAIVIVAYNLPASARSTDTTSASETFVENKQQ